MLYDIQRRTQAVADGRAFSRLIEGIRSDLFGGENQGDHILKYSLYMSLCVHVCVRANGGQKPMLHVFLSHFPHSALRQVVN